MGLGRSTQGLMQTVKNASAGTSGGTSKVSLTLKLGSPQRLPSLASLCGWESMSPSHCQPPGCLGVFGEQT